MRAGDVVQITVRADVEGYRASLVLIQDGRFGNPRLLAEAPFCLHNEQLLALSNDITQYGAYLTDALFTERALDRAWGQATAQAQRIDHPLQIRMQIDPSAAELHRVRWETLCDPVTHAPLAHSRRTPIVRFIPSGGSVPFTPATRDRLSALVVIAAAAPPERVPLPPIDAAVELACITRALGTIPYTILGVQIDGCPPATLLNLRTELQRGYDILYIICHGMLIRGRGTCAEPYLWLESTQHLLTPIRAQDLVTAIADLDSTTRPALAIFASCYSAEDSAAAIDSPRLFQAAVPAFIAPQLASAGVGAVIGMQGLAPRQLVEDFIPVIFRQLLAGEPIDNAITAARDAVKDGDWWMPVLYLRGEDGYLWLYPAPPTITASPVNVVGEALRTLATLLHAPAVHTEVVRFRRDLQDACMQLPILQAYKDIHDYLHQLLLRGVNCIDKDISQRFDEPGARKELRRYISGAQQIITAMLKVIHQLPGTAGEAIWAEQLERMYLNLDHAMAAHDRIQFDVALSHINSILVTSPGQINAVIRAKATMLQFDRLSALMLAIQGVLLGEPTVEIHIRSFEASAQALDQLNTQLHGLVRQHTAWQELDRCARLLEEQDEPHLVAIHWGELQPSLAAVEREESDDVRDTLRQRAAALQSALNAGAEDAIFNALDRVTDTMRYRFFEVDKQLKEHCVTLRLVSSQIEAVLEVLT